MLLGKGRQNYVTIFDISQNVKGLQPEPLYFIGQAWLPYDR